MALSLRSKVLLGALVVGALLAYIVIVDLGVNAGRIHHGVTLVGGVDIGGMTEAEAAEILDERAALLSGSDGSDQCPESSEVTFGAEGLSPVRFCPFEVGWRGAPSATAREAMAVGRENAPFGALLERARAWSGGVEIRWAGTAKPGKVTKIINKVEKQALARGLVLNRGKFRYKIKRAIVTWPRKPWYRIPLEDADETA